MRPNFEEPLDTAKQLVEENITLYFRPEFKIWKQFLMDSPIKEYNILGENVIFANNWDHFDNISKHNVIGAGTHASIKSYLVPSELAMGRWYRSKEKVSGNNPYVGYLTNKKWHLNEVIKISHILNFISLFKYNHIGNG